MSGQKTSTWIVSSSYFVLALRKITSSFVRRSALELPWPMIHCFRHLSVLLKTTPYTTSECWGRNWTRPGWWKGAGKSAGFSWLGRRGMSAAGKGLLTCFHPARLFGNTALLQNTLHRWPLLVLNTGELTITKYKTRRPLWRRATDKETSMWSPQVTLHSFEKQKKTFGAFEVCKQKQIWNNTELHRILWDSLDSFRFFGILWNSVGFIKVFLKILKHS